MSNEFEKWIESSAPAVEADKGMKEVHLAILKQRLRDRDKQYKVRQKRTRRGSIVAVVLMFVLVGGNISELGSDGFELETSESLLVDGMNNVTVGHREFGFGAPKSLTKAETEDFARQAEWRHGQPVGVECLEIQGAAAWFINFHYDLDGSTSLGSHSVRDRPSTAGMDHLNFSQHEYDGMEEKIKNGTLAPVSSRIETVDGFRFFIKVYNFESSEFGSVVFQKGEFIR